MAITSRDFQALQPGVNQLIEGLQKQDQQKMQAQQSEAQERLKAYLAGSRLGENQEAAQKFAQAQGLKPGGYSLSASEGGFSVNPESPVQAAAMNDKMLDNQRLETKAIQDEANKLFGKRREQAKAVTDIENLLNTNSALGQGQLGASLARLSGEVGVLTDQDIKRVMPSSIKGDAMKLWNYLTGQSEPGMTEAQKKAALDLLQTKKGTINQDLAKAESELSTRAPFLAPSLARSQALPKVMEGLGTAAKTPAAQEQRTPVKKQYSPSRNQTRITYSDGTQEILDGKQ